MKITILAFGTQGDIQPLVALGEGLKKAGHSVIFATDKNFQALVSSHEVGFCPITGDIRALIQSEGGQELVAQGQNPRQFAHNLSQLIQPVLMQMMADCWHACQGTDLILPSQWGTYPGIPIAQRLGVPAIKCNLVPMTPTRAFPSTQMPTPWRSLGGWYNYGSGFVAEQFFWQTFRKAVNQAREKVLQMSPESFWGPATRFNRSLPLLYGFSTHVLRRPADWSQNIQVTGYWFLENQAGWQPPKDLADFLEAGSPPVYVGFGSMNNRDPKETAALLVEALSAVKQRGILLRGWGGLSQTDLPKNIRMVDSVPHEWLFSRVAAVVHHGGAGTTAAGMRAGVPTIVIPFMNDQSFWGWRVEQLGVGPKPIPRRQLTATRLAQAIDQTLHSTAIRENAAALGKVLRVEDGVACTVAAIDAIVHKFDRAAT